MENKLNAKQIEAIEHINGPLLILAGAGTGKTTVLVNRIAHILKNNIVFPSNILAVTFTNKASSEMRERLTSIVPFGGKNVNIGTFHSIMLKVLRAHISVLDIGMDNNFLIVDQTEQVQILKKIMQDQNIDFKIFPHKAIYSTIMRIKDRGLNYLEIDKDSYNPKILHLLSVLMPLYQSKLQKSNLVDFSDILSYARNILIKEPSILKYYQNKFKYIHVDEYQDTNSIQYELIKLLVDKNYCNICCVGDDDQSIYGWRGAELTNILRFEEDFPSAKIIKLEQNYRSTRAILESASDLIQNNKTRYKKSLWTLKNLKEDKIKIISALNEIDEADLVTHILTDLHKKEQNAYSDYAILVRSSFQTRSFEEQFISKNIPYKIIGSIRFYERAEIKDALAYIRLCVNNNNDVALERIINKPRRSIGNITLNKIKQYAFENDISLSHAIEQITSNNSMFSKTIFGHLTKFSNLIKFGNQKYKQENASDVTYFLLKESGYIDFLSKNAENKTALDSAIENINELIKAISEFETIDQFMEHIALVTDNNQNSRLKNNGNEVNIMTIHAAKGLEFNTVFLSGWEEGVFPNQKSLSEEGIKGLEEERRLAYVAITRAKIHLYITYAQTRRVFANIVQSLASRFITELPKNFTEEYTSESFLGKSLATNTKFNNQSFKYSVSPQHKTINKYSKQNLKQSSIGKKISHIKFGNGIIVRENDGNLEIIFEKLGLKTIKKNYVTFL